MRCNPASGIRRETKTQGFIKVSWVEGYYKDGDWRESAILSSRIVRGILPGAANDGELALTGSWRSGNVPGA